MTTQRRSLLFLMGVLLLLGTNTKAETAFIELAPGHQKVIKAENVRRAAIGNAKVADVKALQESNQVILTGVSKGSTNLILWFEDGRKETYQILVSTKIRNIEKELRAFLGEMEGVEVSRSAGKVILDGYIYRGEDLDRILRALSLFPGVLNLAKVHPEVLEFIAREIENQLELADITSIQVHGAGDTIHLEGEARSSLEKKRILKLAERLFPQIESEIEIGVSEKSQVLIDIKMMEIRKNSLGEIGISWPQRIVADSQAVFSTGASSASLSLANTSIMLRSLIEKGNARILSNPRLLCRSGSPATFLAGGEVPIRIVGERVAKVEFKPYGVRLKINAQIDRRNRVNLEIEAEVSELDAATAVDGIPGFLQNQVKTSANLRVGDTIVLAGLLANRSRKNIQKVPLLGHIPILGELFKSRSYQNNESEFLVFLQPIPAHVGAYTHEKSLKGINRNMKRAKNEVSLSIFD